MKVTVVPAQVTTVEDRIMGNLSMQQVILLAVPVFGGSMLFAALPPFMGGAMYKYIMLGLLALICVVLSIRIKSKILLLWAVTILKYNLRPAHYVFDKNTLSNREVIDVVKEEAKKAIVEDKPTRQIIPNLSPTDAARIMSLIDDPASKLRFETNRKGGLYVRITEIKE